MNAESDGVEAEVFEKPTQAKKSNWWIWILVAVGMLPILIILLILAAFIVWDFSRIQAGNDVIEAQMQISAFEMGLETYHLDIGEYPTSQQGLEALRVPPVELTDPTKWLGPYHKNDITLDPWSQPYCYERLDSDGYRIYSGGPDGQTGTVDDIMSLNGPDPIPF